MRRQFTEERDEAEEQERKEHDDALLERALILVNGQQSQLLCDHDASLGITAGLSPPPSCDPERIPCDGP